MGAQTICEKLDKNMWANILVEVQENSTKRLCHGKNLIVFGDQESGKTTLVACMQGEDEPRKGCGLEYFQINVNNEEREENFQLQVSIIDSHSYYQELLSFALTTTTFTDSLLIISLSMDKPWRIASSLEKISRELNDFIFNLLKMPPDLFKAQQEKVERAFQSYVEPDIGAENGAGAHTHSGNKSSFSTPTSPLVESTFASASNSFNENQVILPLGENTLTTNLGIPIIVVVTKTDVMETLTKDYDFRNEHYDYIQQYIRRFCLSYGASLFYTSVKESKNCSLLYKYICHKLYGFPFTHGPQIIEGDSIFIPIGWDSEKKIKIISDSLTNFSSDSSFDEVIGTSPESFDNMTAGCLTPSDKSEEQIQSFFNNLLQTTNKQSIQVLNSSKVEAATNNIPAIRKYCNDKLKIRFDKIATVIRSYDVIGADIASSNTFASSNTETSEDSIIDSANTAL